MSINSLEIYDREFDRFMAGQRFYRDPLKWIGKWILVKVVFLVCLAIPFALYLWYYYIFLPWRNK